MNFSVAPVVEGLTLERIEAGVATLRGSPGAINTAKPRKGAIEEALGKAVGRPVRAELKPSEGAADAPEPKSSHLPDSAARAEAMKNPLVRRAMELLDARVVGVDDDPDPPTPGSTHV